MGSEKDSEYETYALKSHGEYARPYTRRNGSVYATPNSSGSEAGFRISARSLIGWRSCQYFENPY